MTDSYKLNHWQQYPEGTKKVYSYFESRIGATFPQTLFFGLQPILKDYLVGQVLTQQKIDQAAELAAYHFGSDKLFNRVGWEYVLNKHDGHLPLQIKAVKEGSLIPTNNVLMTVENTDENCCWLTNFVESLLTHVWYPSTVATLSYNVKKNLQTWLNLCSDSNGEFSLPYMLHDFGYRGATCNEAAEMGGMGHLLNFVGTDTIPAIVAAKEYYEANISTTGFSVPATEHSVMTAEGKDGEEKIVARLLEQYPTGILSIVADSYNIYNFVQNIIPKFKEQILNRCSNDGKISKLVIRPDSITPEHPSPGSQVVWILQQLEKTFGCTINSKGYKVLHPKIGVLWGDGISNIGIDDVCYLVTKNGFSIESLVFGMGGGLLQKVNRDTQRFAFKCSAQYRNGEWIDIWKEPQDKSKSSKRGRLKLVKENNQYKTVPYIRGGYFHNQLVEVFRDGELLQNYKWEEVRRQISA